MKLLDATLREGEQRVEHTYTVEQKIEAARKLDELGVDFVQVGFPVADDRTQRVCETLDIDAKTTGIARAIESDIDAASSAGVDVIDLFAPTSDRQREQLLGTSRDDLRTKIQDTLHRARQTGCEVHFTAMDGFRTDTEFLRELLDSIDAEYVTIADTVGSQIPEGVRTTLDALDGDLSTVGVHFHNDLGVATANALAAVNQGVGKVDVTVAGLGERAGNTPLEEFVVAGEVGSEQVETNVNQADLIRAVESILDTLGEEVAPQKPLVGRTVFEHESGLHTAAMLDDPATFEPFDPATFGGERRLLFGAASGRGAARRLLERARVDPSDSNVTALLQALDDANRDLTLSEAVELANKIGD